MRHLSMAFVVAMLLACNNTPDKTSEKAEPVEDRQPTEDKAPPPPDNPSPSIAEIDMGDYILSIHAITQYHPDEMQTRMMRWNDEKNDYYIIDASVKNKTSSPIDTGRDMLAAYFTFSNDGLSSNILRGASIVGSSQVGKKLKYPKTAYDQIWGSKFPASGFAQAELFGVETPEGVTINGIGFYKNNPAKNKVTKFKAG